MQFLHCLQFACSLCLYLPFCYVFFLTTTTTSATFTVLHTVTHRYTPVPRVPLSTILVVLYIYPTTLPPYYTACPFPNHPPFPYIPYHHRTFYAPHLDFTYYYYYSFRSDRWDRLPAITILPLLPEVGGIWFFIGVLLVPFACSCLPTLMHSTLPLPFTLPFLIHSVPPPTYYLPAPSVLFLPPCLFLFVCSATVLPHPYIPALALTTTPYYHSLPPPSLPIVPVPHIFPSAERL